MSIINQNSNVMTTADHFRLIWPNRPFVMFGAEVVFDDNQPAPSETEMLDTYNEALALWQAEREANNIKKWPTVTEFWDEFTVPEQVSISSSADNMVTLLRTNLAMWRGAVHANHPQIVQGLGYLAAIGVLTTQRVTEINQE